MPYANLQKFQHNRLATRWRSTNWSQNCDKLREIKRDNNNNIIIILFIIIVQELQVATRLQKIKRIYYFSKPWMDNKAVIGVRSMS